QGAERELRQAISHRVGQHHLAGGAGGEAEVARDARDQAVADAQADPAEEPRQRQQEDGGADAGIRRRVPDGARGGHGAHSLKMRAALPSKEAALSAAGMSILSIATTSSSTYW